MRRDSLDGKVVLVTGGGRGIGRSVAKGAAARGARVVVTARTEGQITSVVREIERAGGKGLPVVGDVSDAASVSMVVREAMDVFGPIDVLVNNAGVVSNAQVAEMEEPTWDEILDVNLKGAFLYARAVLPAMLERGHGRIVNVSSISGTIGTPGLSAYCASKWGLLGFTEALAEEVRDRGVVVAAVAPGSVDTEMLQAGVPGLEPDMTAEDVAGVVLYLAGDAPRAITGSTVRVFG